MRFFNIREQVVSLVMPGGKTATTLAFSQNPADAMVQELRIYNVQGGPTAVLLFDKAGDVRETRWEGLDGAPVGDLDAAQLDQQQASELGLKPSQKSVDSGGRLVQAPGVKSVPKQMEHNDSDGPKDATAPAPASLAESNAEQPSPKERTTRPAV